MIEPAEVVRAGTALLSAELALDEEEDGESLAIIYDHAGDIAQAQGRRSDARGHWERALEFDPANAQLIEKLQR